MKIFKNKVCRVCSSAFIPVGAKQFYCKQCAPLALREYNQKKALVYMREARKHTPKKIRGIHRKHTLSRLGWTPELYASVFAEQKATCAICFCPIKNANEERAPIGTPRNDIGCADHKHGVTPVPRGILCSRCNVMLAMAQDNQETLDSAIQYLKRHQ